MPPLMPYHAYKSYRFLRPDNTHWRKATCAEVECEQFSKGWYVRIDALTPEDIHTLRNCGRSFKEVHVSEHENYYFYPPGQPCFKSNKHELPTGLEPIYLVQRGDYRRRAGSPFRHTSVESWMDDMNEHQDNIKRIIERG